MKPQLPTVGTGFTTGPLSAAFPSWSHDPNTFPVFPEPRAGLHLNHWLYFSGEWRLRRRYFDPQFCSFMSPDTFLSVSVRRFLETPSEARGSTRPSPSPGSLPTRMGAASS